MQKEHALHGRAMKSKLVPAKNPPKIHQKIPQNKVQSFQLESRDRVLKTVKSLLHF
jgi:hypothetical protein